jgi:hypothetical protein
MSKRFNNWVSGRELQEASWFGQNWTQKGLEKGKYQNNIKKISAEFARKLGLQGNADSLDQIVWKRLTGGEHNAITTQEMTELMDALPPDTNLTPWKALQLFPTLFATKLGYQAKTPGRGPGHWSISEDMIDWNQEIVDAGGYQNWKQQVQKAQGKGMGLNTYKQRVAAKNQGGNMGNQIGGGQSVPKGQPQASNPKQAIQSILGMAGLDHKGKKTKRFQVVVDKLQRLIDVLDKSQDINDKRASKIVQALLTAYTS